MAKFVSKENLAYYHSKIKTPLKFAQEEYNKSRNLVVVNNINTTNNGVTFSHNKESDIWVLNGTSNSSDVMTNFTNCCSFEIQANKQYCVELIPISGSYTTTGNIDFRYYPNSGLYNEPFLRADFDGDLNILTKSTSGSINNLYMYWEQPVTFNNFTFKINVSTHGEIVHKVDITPVLLWENASPNSAFVGNNTHNLSKSLSNYTSLKILYKFNTSNNASYIEEFKTDGIGTGWRYIERRNYSRVFTIPSATSIRFENGYIDSSINDEAIIPLAVYGVK